MSAVAVDFETHLFRPGVMAPRPVCLSWASSKTSRVNVGRDMKYDLAGSLLNQDQIVGHSVAYDMAVALEAWPDMAEHIWSSYEDGRILCTAANEKLLDIAIGKHMHHGGKAQYSLAAITKRRFDVDLDKTTWRMGYGALENVPLKQWPQGAIDYARGDAEITLRLLEDQYARAKEIRYPLKDAPAQARAAFALHLMGAWGIRTDGKRVEALEKKIVKRMDELRPAIKDLLNDKGGKSILAMRKIVQEALGDRAPRTPKGALRINKDTLAGVDHPAAKAWVEYSNLEKTLSTYVSKMRAGTERPIHARYNVLVDSGRTSCGDPNWQNLPRLPGVRECVVPRPGFVFVACDFDSQEMRTWAQACLTMTGKSKLAEKYRNDPSFDPHTAMAARLMNITEEEALRLKKAKDPELKIKRQMAKIPNFGLPGGMGPSGLQKFAWGSYGVKLSTIEASVLRDLWRQQWPEQADYFRIIDSWMSYAGQGDVTQLVTGRRRAGCYYTDAANTLFQGLAADASKAALFEVSRRCYSVPSSNLYGCRPVAFVHDEVIIEAPEEYAHEAAIEIEEVMCEQMARFTPDVPPMASAHSMRRWIKNAEAVYGKHDRLIPYEEKKAA